MGQKGSEPTAIGKAVADAIEAKTMKPIIRVDAFSKMIAVLVSVMPSTLFRSQLKKSLDIA